MAEDRKGEGGLILQGVTAADVAAAIERRARVPVGAVIEITSGVRPSGTPAAAWPGGPVADPRTYEYDVPTGDAVITWRGREIDGGISYQAEDLDALAQGLTRTKDTTGLPIHGAWGANRRLSDDEIREVSGYLSQRFVGGPPTADESSAIGAHLLREYGLVSMLTINDVPQHQITFPVPFNDEHTRGAPTDDELRAVALGLSDDARQRLYDLLYALGCRR